LIICVPTHYPLSVACHDTVFQLNDASGATDVFL
jgi:hypothetical protein